MAIDSISRDLSHRTQHPALGPRVIFGVAVLAALGAAAFSRAVLPAEAVVPAIATLFFVMAAIAGLLAWSGSRSSEPHRLTYWDVAGALVFIGICMAALVQPDQLVSLVATGPRG